MAVTVTRRALPLAVVALCVLAALGLTRGLGASSAPSAGAPAQPGRPSASGQAGPAGPPQQQRAPGPLAELLPAPADLGLGWVVDDDAASQQITDGAGLLHPCGVDYPSDVQRLEVLRRSVVQDPRVVPRGTAMTFELSRYAGSGSQQAVTERVAALRSCPSYSRDFAGYAGTDVHIGLLARPAGESSSGAHLAVTALTPSGPQGIEYTYLLVQQGDALLSAVTGDGNGVGPSLDSFAESYFTVARQKLAGLSHRPPGVPSAQPGPP